jgi:hypothetical protein
VRNHRGLLLISGQAPDALVFEYRHETGAHVDTPSQLDRATMRARAKDALAELGYKRREAASAVEAANTHIGPEVTLEHLIREALRRLVPRDSVFPKTTSSQEAPPTSGAQVPERP